MSPIHWILNKVGVDASLVRLCFCRTRPNLFMRSLLCSCSCWSRRFLCWNRLLGAPVVSKWPKSAVANAYFHASGKSSSCEFNLTALFVASVTSCSCVTFDFLHH